MLTHAYNCTKNNATGSSPYSLLYGRDPTLPIDLEFGVKPQDGVTTTFKYTERLKHRLDWSYRKAKEVSEREAKRNKRRYDRRIRCTKLQKGDLVLVRQKAYKGKHKIADRWENEPYEVICQIDKRFPVYKVQCLSLIHI